MALPVSSWLDFKLGIRMLIKYPVLTVVGGLAMAFGIGAGVGTFEAINLATDPVLPLPEGDRIVGFGYRDRTTSDQKATTAYDFHMWRQSLRTVEDLGAFRLVQRNLAVGQEGAEPVEVAEISAAAFRVTRTAPMLGRTLVESDEDRRATPVVVIGHRLWQTRFAADPVIVGRVVRLGDEQVTVVGVMPEGFAFPVHHSLWTALRSRESPREPSGRPLQLFGRLAPGVTLQQAQAEAATVVARAAADFPEHYANLTPHVLPYVTSIIWIPPDLLVRAGIQSINLFAGLFLIVVCGNVALLMFARAATREREILVRSALGASRNRIVMQLFAEALVLGTLAAVVGVTATNLGVKWALDAMSSESDEWPFWIEGGLSATTWVYAILLTLLAAAVTGVLPALKVTAGNLESRLRRASAGGGGLRMGGIWTVLIVAQIAATVLFTAVASVAQRQAAQIASTTAAFPAEEYLGVRLEMDQPPSTDGQTEAAQVTFRQQYTATVRSLAQRLEAEPAVAGATLAERLPLMPQSDDRIEVDEGSATSLRAEYRTATAAVDLYFFDVFQGRALSGRGFTSSDVEKGANIALVNRLFVEKVFAGRNAIGRRIRYKPRRGQSSSEPGPWIEIVGVVPDLVPDIHAPLKLDNPAKPVVYRPLVAANSPVYLALHVRGDAAAFATTLRRVATDLSPTLRLTDIQRLDLATSGDTRAWRVLAHVITFISAITLFLSLAGIYAVMSFTVTRHTREIAVRVALGAQARAVVFDVLRRPVSHVALGSVLGCLPIGGLMALSTSGTPSDASTMAGRVLLLVGYAMLMVGVCALACIGPTVRVLRVQPTEALREER